jgi:hypothetical protein
MFQPGKHCQGSFGGLPHPSKKDHLQIVCYLMLQLPCLQPVIYSKWWVICQLNYHVAIITSTSNPKLIHAMNSRHIVSLQYQELPVLTIPVHLNSKYIMYILAHSILTLSWTPTIIEWDACKKTSKEKGPRILGAPSQYSIQRLFFYCLLRRCNTGTESANQIFTQVSEL